MGFWCAQPDRRRQHMQNHGFDLFQGVGEIASPHTRFDRRNRWINFKQGRWQVWSVCNKTRGRAVPIAGPTLRVVVLSAASLQCLIFVGHCLTFPLVRGVDWSMMCEWPKGEVNSCWGLVQICAPSSFHAFRHFNTFRRFDFFPPTDYRVIWDLEATEWCK